MHGHLMDTALRGGQSHTGRQRGQLPKAPDYDSRFGILHVAAVIAITAFGGRESYTPTL